MALFGRRKPGSQPAVSATAAALQRFAADNGGPHLVHWSAEHDVALPGATADGRLLYLDEARAPENPIGLQYEHVLVAIDPQGAVRAVVTAETAQIHAACYLAIFADGRHANLGDEPDLRGGGGRQAFLDRAIPLAEERLRSRAPGASSPAAPTAPPPPAAIDAERARARLAELRQAARGRLDAGEELSAELAELALLLEALGAPDAAAAAGAAAARPDAEALFQAGYQLIDVGLDDLAVAPLIEARGLRPDDARVLMELVVALEGCQRYAQAVAMMTQVAPHLLEREELLRALCAHDAAMTGDLATTRRLHPTLGDGPGVAVLRRLAGARIARADALAAIGRPVDGDLRAWEVILNSTVVLDVAGPEYEGMGGRWGAVWDDQASFAGRLTALQHALARAERAVSVVAHTPDRDSKVLAWALGARLGRPVAPLTGDLPSHTLVTAFSSRALAAAGAEAIRFSDPSAVLFAYSLDWTYAGQPAPDIVGVEAQAMFPLWGERMRVVGDLGHDARVDSIAPDVRPAAELGRELGATAAEADAAQLADVLALIDAVRAGGAASGLTGGDRQRFYPGGPVESSRLE